MNRHIWLSFAMLIGCSSASTAQSSRPTSSTSTTTSTTAVPAPVPVVPPTVSTEAPPPKPRPVLAAGGGAPPLDRIARCESGGNPRAVSRSGRYRGKYQFDARTWASVGGSGDPAEASEAEQDDRAAQLYARRGAQPWPSCGR